MLHLLTSNRDLLSLFKTSEAWANIKKSQFTFLKTSEPLSSLSWEAVSISKLNSTQPLSMLAAKIEEFVVTWVLFLNVCKLLRLQHVKIASYK